MRHVPHVYVPGPWETEELGLDEDHRHHLARVLRLTDGAAVTYTDGAGRTGRGSLAGASIIRGDESVADPARQVTMAVAPPDAKDRARFLVEKLAELGVARLRWLATVHGQGHPPRLDRARAWALAALEQSRGSWLMEIDDAVAGFAELPRPLMVAAPGGEPAPAGAGDVTIAIGPEGGWAPDEIPPDALLMDLGPTILRVETAAIVAAARMLA